MKFQVKLFTMFVILILTPVLAACAASGGSVLDLKGTNWQVIEINGEIISEEMDVTASFGDDGRIAGKAACNQYFADYTQDGANLTFGMVGMTKMMCSDSGLMETEAAFSQALVSVVRLEGDINQVRLLDSSGKTMLVLAQPRPAAALDKTSWQLIELQGQSLPVGVVITIEFADGQASGRAACNSFFAGYTQDNYNLSFSQVGGTEMYCEGLMDYESATYNALSQVAKFTLKNDILTMLDAGGTALLVYSTPQAAPALEGTSWKAIMVGEQQIPEDREVTMVFENGNVGGTSACNSYSASYTQDGGSLKFGMAAVTMMYCDGEGVMDLEQTFLAGLDKVRSFQFEMGNLVLLDENGQYLVVLVR